MDIVKINIEELNSAEYNPRKDLQPNDPEYVKLKNSIEHFGYVDPIIVNKIGNIVVGGHQRLKVLRDLGYSEIDVVYVELNKTDEKALNIALNKISGDWDADKLEDLIREISLESDFDVELTGFTLDEIDTMFSGNLEEAEEVIDRKVDKLDVIDDSDNIDEAEAEKNPRNIKLGDVFKLGRHILMCGDSTDKEQVLKLIGENKVELLMTDPPYDQNYNNPENGIGNLYKSFNKYKDSSRKLNETNLKTVEDIKDLSFWDVKKISYLSDLNFPSCYIFTSNKGIKDYLDIFKEYNFNVLVWCKKDPTPFKHGMFYSDIEYMLYFYKKGRIWNNDLMPSNIYKKFYLTEKLQGVKDNDNEKVHPTMKPMELISDKMQISSSEGGVVLDLFGGSGTTLIVAEQLGRTCLMMEYEPKYMNVIIDRYEKYTGEKAEKLEV